MEQLFLALFFFFSKTNHLHVFSVTMEFLVSESAGVTSQSLRNNHRKGKSLVSLSQNIQAQWRVFPQFSDDMHAVTRYNNRLSNSCSGHSIERQQTALDS